MDDTNEKKIVKSGAGYVLVDPEQLDGTEPKNVHVLEANVKIYDDKSRGWEITKRVTCCGLDMRKGNSLFCRHGEEYLKGESRALRNELARLQNTGTHVCGVCASHFYADYLDEQ